MMLRLTAIARDALEKGRADGTIEDTEKDVIRILMRQEVVSYCSEHGTYTFDYLDVVKQALEDVA